jgi:hypothetical protein
MSGGEFITMKKLHICLGILIWVSVLNLDNTRAQTAPDAANRKGTLTSKSKQVAEAATTPVTGNGSAGQLTKWLGSDGSSFTIGNSIITESKFGQIGIGTTTPTSKLTVQGMIQTTVGGYKFPDGTMQTTAGLTVLSHDDNFTGNGTSAMPLKLAVPVRLTGPALPFEATLTARSIGQEPLFGFGGTGIAGLGGESTFTSGIGVFGAGGEAIGTSAFGGAGLYGFGGSNSATTIRGGEGVVGQGGNGAGIGVRATGGPGNPVGGVGLLATGGFGNTAQGLAGQFLGNVDILGTLSRGAGSFKIDHPLDPENKYLYHSFVESPEMMNIYNGNVTTDANGDAVITLPDWFEALNKDFRYQLTLIGTFAQAIVGSEIKENRFVIKTSAANVKVSWQVTGVRQDAYANRHRIKVEEDKPAKERGYFLHPDVFNQPEEKGIEWARHPEFFKEVQEKRELLLKEQKRNRPNQ